MDLGFLHETYNNHVLCAVSGEPMADLSQDPRLLVAEHAVSIMSQSLDGKMGAQIIVGKDKVKSDLHEVNTLLMQLKYSYMDLESAARCEMVRDIMVKTETIYHDLEAVIKADGTPPLSRSRLFWGIRILGRLGPRFLRGEGGMSKGVDLVVAKVRSAVASGNLTVCRLDTGVGYTSVTNLPGIVSGRSVGVAILPPVEVGGVVSEAMFLGGEEVDGDAGSIIEDDMVDTREIESILYSILPKR